MAPRARGGSLAAGTRGLTSPATLCRLCGAEPALLGRAQGRTWLDCPECGLLSVVPDDLPSEVDERARYETHENQPGDPRYRAFLDRLALPLQERLAPGAEGLDVGSGPGPTLSLMLSERGFPTAIWDPFFAPDPTPLQRTWDFVTCSETVEHFHDPAAGWARLFGLVRPGGWLGVMTEPIPEPAGQELEPTDLNAWWYARDPTHVALHRGKTLEWLAQRYGAELLRPSRTVTLFRAPSA